MSVLNPDPGHDLGCRLDGLSPLCHFIGDIPVIWGVWVRVDDVGVRGDDVGGKVDVGGVET